MNNNNQSKGVIVNGSVYSPQKFLEAVTGKTYFLSYDKPLLPQIENILIAHRKPHSSYPLVDAQKALNKKGNIVLVSCCDISENHQFQEDYRWFRVSRDFNAA